MLPLRQPQMNNNPTNRVFGSQTWTKAKICSASIMQASRQHAANDVEKAKDVNQKMRSPLAIDDDQFEERLAAG
jgi:alpha-L-arabinofuranosidase